MSTKILCDRCGDEIDKKDTRAGNFLHIKISSYLPEGSVTTTPQPIQISEDLCGNCTKLVHEALGKVSKKTDDG